jgi:hypothetical protein
MTNIRVKLGSAFGQNRTSDQSRVNQLVAGSILRLAEILDAWSGAAAN